MLRSTIFLALAGLAVATDSVYFSTPKAAQQKGLPLLSGFTPRPQVLAMMGSCNSGETECGNTCIPTSGQCCSRASGTYCEDGYHCQAQGCCEDGKLCNGPPTGCTEGKQLCGGYCIPKGKVCCLTGYCDEGEKCTSDGKCSGGGSSGGGGGSSGGSSGGSDSCLSFQETCGDGCMPKGMVCCETGYCLKGQTCGTAGTCKSGGSSGGGSGGSSGGSSSGSCASYQEKCGSGCMPKGMVCCDTGYCLSGQVCGNDGTCRYRSGGGGGGSSGGDADNDKFSITRNSPTLTHDSPSFTAPSLDPVPTLDTDSKFPSITAGAVPTGPRSGGDDDGSSSGSSGSGGSNSGSILLPSFFMGLIAMIPLLL
ncbi:hypothetical protein F53441_8933 [Fusarium austroafricanum]|uniref:GPI anchored protein n=1 Tax=Fusarium austroafricanum TaxID=2364996 RepID=A0A8H4KEH3_9HYPO|nr:hypothetical protein F53441_8933 [Fusarium austroafricanum]